MNERKGASTKELEKKATELLSKDPRFVPSKEGTCERVLVESLPPRISNNIDSNGQVFYNPTTVVRGTCTVVHYLYLKYIEEKGLSDCTAKDLSPFVQKILEAESKGATGEYKLFSRSSNPFGRIGRTLTETRKLVRRGGRNFTAKTFRARVPKEYLAVIEA